MFCKYAYTDNENTAFTLIELVAVLVIVGILSAMALPRYFRSREKTVDKHAQMALSMIRAAERIHWMENGSYYPSSGTVTNTDHIIGNLSLDFIADGNWSYSISGDGSGFTATLTRAGGWGYARNWMINSSVQNATCSGDCP